MCHCIMFCIRLPPTSTLFPYTTLFRSVVTTDAVGPRDLIWHEYNGLVVPVGDAVALAAALERVLTDDELARRLQRDRKSTRLNSSHRCISYAVFCLKKKKNLVASVLVL